MKKICKQFISICLVVLMVFSSIPLTSLIGLNFGGLTASAASVDYSDLTKNQYMSKVILNYNYKGVLNDYGKESITPQSSLYSYYVNQSNSRSFHQLCNEFRNATDLKTLNAVYGVLTFDPSAFGDVILGVEDIYAGILLNILGSKFEDKNFIDDLNCSANQFILSSSSNIAKSLEITLDGLAEDTVNSMTTFNYKHMNSTQKNRVLNGIMDSIEGSQFWELVGKDIGYIKTVVKGCTTVADVVKTIAKYEQLTMMNNATKAVVKSLYDNATDPLMRTAINNIYKYICAETTDSLLALAESGKTIANLGMSWLIDKWWTGALAACTSGPIAAAILVGQALGKGLSNLLFATDEVNDKLCAIYGIADFESVMVKTVKSFESNYKKNESVANADKFIKSLEFLFALYDLETEYSSDFLKAAYTKGVISKLLHGGSKSYKQWCTQISEQKSLDKKRTEMLTLSKIEAIYKIDAPSGYNYYFGSLEDMDFGSPITTAKINTVCKEYGYRNGVYWTYEKGGSKKSGYKASGRAGRDYSYYYNGVECYGFANFVMSKVTGTNVYPGAGNKNGWVKLQPKDVTELRVGDIVRIGKNDSNGHTGIVLTVDNGKCTFLQCLGGVNNMITTGKALAGTKSLNNNYKSYSTLSAMKNDGALVYVYRYKGSTTSTQKSVSTYYNPSADYKVGNYIVTAKAGLNLRSQPTATSSKLGAVKYNTSVKVTATDGNWGYTSKGWICLNYTRYVSDIKPEKYENVNYETGTYMVNTPDGLNYRKGAGTEFAKLGALKNYTQFEVTQVDGSWGYSEKLGGWLCLTYATYVCPLVPALPVPDMTVPTSTTSSVIAVGEIINVSWAKVENADKYTAILIDASNNKTIETKAKITNTSVSFVAPYAGTFNVAIISENEQHSSEQSYIYGIEAKAPVTVTFKDWNGNVLSTQNISYGKDATLPTSPEREGYTFTGWAGDHTKVYENRTITAQYERNSYLVTFYDYDGKTVVDTQSVLYGDSATAPSYKAPTGYSFVNWDTSYTNITGPTNVKAVIQWTSKYPLEISTASSIYRNGKTYITTAIVNNSPNAVSNAKVIVALKTAENKEVAEIVSGNLSIAAGEVKNLTLNITYDGAATVGNIFVVKADDQNIPLAKHLVVEVNQGTAWSTWSTTAPPSNALDTESRTEYRYRTKSYTTSSDANLSGWTKYNTTSAYSGWSGWSAWQDASVSSTDLREVKTQTVQDTTKYTAWSNWGAWQDTPITSSNLVNVETRQVVASTKYKTVYHYYYYNKTNSEKDGDTSYYKSNTYKYGPWKVTFDSALPTTTGGTSVPVTKYKWSNHHGTGKYMYVYADDPYTTQEVVSQTYKTQYRSQTRSYGTKTQYSYRTRSLNYTYYYYKWSDWSGWSTDKATANNDKEVQTRTTYRYISNIPANVEDKSGTVRNISGYVDKAYAGSYALIRIYSADGTTQYYDQTAIGNDGSYRFTFKLKNEPTLSSGDYLVSLSIEGTNKAISLESIKAPVPEYTVTFKNYDGSVLSTQTIKKGENAVVPSVPELTGHDFIGWDKATTNIQANMTITAQFAKKKFDVVFVDQMNETVQTQQYEYGSTINAPTVDELPDSYEFIGWDAILEGRNIVENSMVINAIYMQKEFSIVFMNYDGSVVSEQTVLYGDGAEIPTLNDTNYSFIAWDTEVDLNYVTDNAVIYPIYEYCDYVDTPSANIETGTYNGAQLVELTCDTENAQIYYTLDGSDPLEEVSTYSLRSASPSYLGTLYTGPIKIDSSSELRFVAVKDGMNSSAYEDATYSIKNSNDGNVKHLVTVHYGLNDYTYSILVDNGSLVDIFDTDNPEEAYELKGIYTDSSYKNEWNLNSDAVTGSMDLYLLWEQKTFTVTFLDMNDAVLSTQHVDYLESASAPTPPEVEGFIFDSWDTEFVNVCSDLTIKAQYSNINDVTEVSLPETQLIFADDKTEAQLNPTIKLGNGKTNSHIIWKSSDETVATVDDCGNVKAKQDGIAIIYATAEDSGCTVSCTVYVALNNPCNVLGHDYKAAVTNSTCTERGYTTHTCSVCGDSYTDSEKAALGHNVGNFVVTIAPTCLKDGLETANCSRCTHSETRVISATGHADNDNDGYCDSCDKELDSSSSGCSHMCHKSGFIGIIWKIINFFQKLFKINPVCECGVAHY